MASRCLPNRTNSRTCLFRCCFFWTRLRLIWTTEGTTSVTSTTSCCLLVGAVAIATLVGAHDLAAEILVGFAGPLTGEMGLAGEEMQNGTDAGGR